MGDFKTTSYQSDLLKYYGDVNKNTNIYYELPDQFTQYEYRSYNPIDFLTSSGEFNLDLINKSYREEQLKRMKHFRKLEKQRLALAPQPPPSILSLSLGDNVLEFQKTFEGIFDDLTNHSVPISLNIFTKDNRLFYLGILLLMIFFAYMIINNIQK